MSVCVLCVLCANLHRYINTYQFSILYPALTMKCNATGPRALKDLDLDLELEIHQNGCAGVNPVALNGRVLRFPCVSPQRPGTV